MLNLAKKMCRGLTAPVIVCLGANAVPGAVFSTGARGQFEGSDLPGARSRA